jgi:ribosomal-protein-alanine N-acetyltransferase
VLGVPELERLRADHAPALLTFETENRAYFAAAIPDRGDAFFREFDARLRGLLEAQAAGTDHFHVLVESDGSIVGRVNLIEVAAAANLGYRIAERAAGKGVATAAVTNLFRIAANDYGLTVLRAATTRENIASQTVLRRTGFVPTGDTTLNGRAAITFARQLDR